MSEECDGFAELSGVGAVGSECVFGHEDGYLAAGGVDEGLEEGAMCCVWREVVAAAVEP